MAAEKRCGRRCEDGKGGVTITAMAIKLRPRDRGEEEEQVEDG